VTLGPLGAAAFAGEDFARARSAWEESCEAFRAAGDRFLLASPLCWLAVLALREGDWAHAEALAGEALETLRHTGDVPRVGEALALLARARLERVGPGEAAECLRQAVVSVRGAGGSLPALVPTAWILTAAAELAARLGRWEDVSDLVATARSSALGAETRAVERPEVEHLLREAAARLGAGFEAPTAPRLGHSQALDLALEVAAHA
jgi:hypothetical protein